MGQTQQSSRSLELKVELQKPAGMPDLATTYCTQFQFNVDGSVTSIVFGQNGTWHAGVSIATADGRNRTGKLVAHQSGSRLTRRGKVASHYGSIVFGYGRPHRRDQLPRHCFDLPAVAGPPHQRWLGRINAAAKIRDNQD